MTISIKRAVFFTGAALLVASFSLTSFADDAMVGTGGYARAMHTMGMMKMLDANGDHMVSKEEFDDYYGKVFDELDTNHDGELDAKEWVGIKGQQELSLTTGGYATQLRTMKMMKAMDTDGDHKVSKDEFIGFHQKIFAAMDKKSDGMITSQEWAGKALAGQ